MPIELLKPIEYYKLDYVEKKITKISEPLFRDTSICFFEYDKSFEDRSRITLTTNASWVYYYYNSGYYRNGMHHRDISTYKSGFNLWNSVGRSIVTDAAREKFKIDNGFTIIDRSNQICEFYHFASALNQGNMPNFYLNNIRVLRRFIAYFKCEAVDIIKYCLQHKIFYNTKNENNVEIKSHLIEIKSFFEKTPINKFYFHIDGSQTHLTRRELDISYWLIEGKTAYEISLILSIDCKTVESHIENIKRKLNCYRQTQIVYKLLKLEVDKIIGVS